MSPQTVRLLWGLGIVATTGAIVGGVVYALTPAPAGTAAKPGPSGGRGLTLPALAVVELNANGLGFGVPQAVSVQAGGAVLLRTVDGTPIRSITPTVGTSIVAGAASNGQILAPSIATTYVIVWGANSEHTTMLIVSPV